MNVFTLRCSHVMFDRPPHLLRQREREVLRTGSGEAHWVTRWGAATGNLLAAYRRRLIDRYRPASVIEQRDRLYPPPERRH